MPTVTTSSKPRKAKAKARKPAAAKARPAASATATTSAGLGDYAERAVLIPVGAALIARERVVSSVSDTISTYSSSSRTQAQLRRFERRGVTARHRLEREVRKARVRVERGLRQRRRVIEGRVSDLEDRRDALAKNGSELASKLQDRVLNLV
jgi:hypothetical protein